MIENVSEILNQLNPEEIGKLKLFLSLMPNISKSDVKQKVKEVVTLRVFTNEYSEYIKSNLSKAYHISVDGSFKHLLKFFSPHKPISSIGLREIEAFSIYLQKEVPKGFRIYIKNYKAAFNKAVDWEYLAENYFLKIKLPKKQKVNPNYINADKLKVICDRINNETIRDMVIVAFYTGMRREELVQMTWRNICLNEKTITVGDENFTTKGRNQRHIPVCEEIYNILAKKAERRKIIKLKDDYVFTKNNGQRISGDHLSKEFKRACNIAGIDDSIHYHSLRHSFASNLVQRGVSLYVIKELLGHTSITTTEIYSHLNLGSLKNAIKLFDNIPDSSTMNEEAAR
jgi:site-specific recombinase XerD